MKKLAFIFVLLVLTQMNLYGQTYCPVSFPGGVAPITSVKFGAVNNSSATVSTTAHELFTSTIDTIYGGVIELVVRGNTGGNFTDSITAYFDWNSDGDFLDTFEVYHIGTITNSGGNNLTEAAIALIPTYNVFSSVDTVRMRIVKKRGVSGSSCNTSGIGQAEDYDLCFIGSFPCAGTPNAGIASVSSAYLCNNTAFVLSLSGYTFSHSHSWQWQESPKGLNIWTNISGATTPTFIVQGITSAKDYMIIATCANAGGFDISNVVSVSNSYASFTNNSPVCVGDTINVAMNPCPNCSVSIFGPGGFSDSQ
ncbi:MAG TPA: GEVED domain-containing protein, partial [Flavipsychrobacter sp.]|nr:GEVED domain-containing protein [Flavipsychrobacter sp.]